MIVLLILYVFFLLGMIAFGGSALYHAYRFGYVGDKTRLAAAIYIGTVLVLVSCSVALVAMTDWSGGFS